MIDWLNSLPDAVIVIGFAVLMGALIIVIPLIIRSLPIVAPTPENTDFVMRIQGTLFVMSGFALAFTLAQAQANVRHVDALVAAEAGHQQPRSHPDALWRTVGRRDPAGPDDLCQLGGDAGMGGHAP